MRTSFPGSSHCDSTRARLIFIETGNVVSYLDSKCYKAIVSNNSNKNKKKKKKKKA